MKRILCGVAVVALSPLACATDMSVTIEATAAGYYSNDVWVAQPVDQLTTFEFDLDAKPWPGVTAPYQTIYQGGVTFTSSGFGDQSGMTPTSYDPVSGANYATYPSSGELTSSGGYANGGSLYVDVVAQGGYGIPPDPSAQVTGRALWNFWQQAATADYLQFHAVSSHCFSAGGSQVCVPEEYFSDEARIVGISLSGGTLPVPEPADALLAASGLALLSVLRRRRRASAEG